MSETTKGQPARIGVYMKSHVHERAQQLTSACGMTLSELIEGFVSTMSMAEIEQMKKRMYALRRLEESLHRKATLDMLQVTRGKDANHILQMAQAAENIEQDAHDEAHAS